MKRNTILLLLAGLIFLTMAAPCFAFGGFGMPSGGGGLGTTGLGAGIMFPDIEGVENDNTLFYSLDFKSMGYVFEVDYFNDADMDGWMLHGDYLYPLGEALASEAYIGIGYSYIFGNSDYLGDENGFNLCLGVSLMDNLDIRGRYLILGGGDAIIQAGATLYL
jgi:hypothetical protein